MVQITQTDDEIKVIIELNRLITRKPDIVLLPLYIKFNNPPIFFERHLTHEIDEMASFCRVFKKEARLVLVKKEKGIWPEIFKTFSKEELFKKRLEISDLIIERNKERDQKAIERYEQKRRLEIDKEVKRETAMRDHVKEMQDKACREAMMVGIRKETHAKPQSTNAVSINNRTPNVGNNSSSCVSGSFIGSNSNSSNTDHISTPIIIPMPEVRKTGTINVTFSDYNFATPKRQSQEGKQRPFIIQDREDVLKEMAKEQKSSS